MRVASLLPAATEACFALGVAPVAVSSACDYPPAARSLPAIVRTPLTNDGSSEAVNRAVASADRADGMFTIDRDALETADPDLVLTQGICDVCAIDGSAVRSALDSIGLDAEVLSFHAHTLSGVLAEIEQLGTALGQEETAATLLEGLRDRIETVERRAAQGAATPRTVVLDWMEPPMVAGHWVPDLVARAGGRYGLADGGDRSTVREWADVLAYDPEVVVVGPCGFGLERTLAHADELTGRSGWGSLAAVDSGRVYAMDGSHFLNRPGPRLVDTLEHLAGLLQPDRFPTPPTEAVERFAPAADH